MGFNDFPREKVERALQSAAEVGALTGQDYFATSSPPKGELVVHHSIMSDMTRACEPSAVPLFLGIVWPVLSGMGWRIDAGEESTGVLFVSPDNAGQGAKGFNKESRERHRRLLHRATMSIGYGTLSKEIKIRIRRILEGDDVHYRFSGGVWEEFRFYLVDGVVEAHPQVAIADSIQAMRAGFEGLVTTWHEKASFGNAHEMVVLLVRFLLLLPALLEQSQVSGVRVRESLDVGRALLLFVVSRSKSENRKGLSETLQGVNVEAELQAAKDRILLRAGAGDKPFEDMSEALLDEDKASLSDFFVKVMEQVVPCISNNQDLGKKNRKLVVGFPGLMCRHCRGKDGEGRYFFTTLESLATSSTVFEKHLGKCSAVSGELKVALHSAKTTHSEQRKVLPTGAQQAYFIKLWERLKTSSIDDDNQNFFPDLEATATPLQDDEDGANDDAQESFDSHLLLLDYLRTTWPWSNNTKLRQAMIQYYSCLGFGGRLLGTSSMPSHFSSEWLLSKIVPRKTTSRPRFPG